MRILRSIAREQTCAAESEKKCRLFINQPQAALLATARTTIKGAAVAWPREVVHTAGITSCSSALTGYRQLPRVRAAACALPEDRGSASVNCSKRLRSSNPPHVAGRAKGPH